MRIEPDRIIEVLNSLFAPIQYAVSLASLMVGLSHLRREFNGLVKTGNSTLSVTFASPVHALRDLFLSLCDFFRRVFRRNSDNERQQNHKRQGNPIITGRSRPPLTPLDIRSLKLL